MTSRKASEVEKGHNKQHRLLRDALAVFFRDWFAYFFLVLAVNSLIINLILPICNYVMRFILYVNDIPFLSYTNILLILIYQPFAAIEIIFLVIVLFFGTFLHFSFLIQGVMYIKVYHRLDWINIIKITGKDLGKISVFNFLIYAFYFVLILPISGVFFKSPFISKVKLPNFLLDFILSNTILSTLLVAIYIICLYFSLRMLMVLPLTFFEKQKISVIIKKSWLLTQKNLWQLIWRSVLLVILIALLAVGLLYILYFIQIYIDSIHHNRIALLTAILSVLLFQFMIIFFNTLNFVTFFNMLTSYTKHEFKQPAMPSTTLKKRSLLQIIFTIFFLVFIIKGVYDSYVYMTSTAANNIVTISHRGVTNRNGVQNTIPALEKTVKKEKPDYVEIDVRETKDNQFVVLHDENLALLARIYKAPHDLTLDELKQITIRENGYTAKINSFDDYLAAAEKTHQRLLIEIKTTKRDSKDMVNNFTTKYGPRLRKNKSLVQSFDYKVVTQLRKNHDDLFSSYILPFSLSFPNTVSDAYSLEETTLTKKNVSTAHKQGKIVFAWTVNEVEDMNRMVILGVDGIITDNLEDLNKIAGKYATKEGYAERFFIYANDLLSVLDTGNSETP